MHHGILVKSEGVNEMQPDRCIWGVLQNMRYTLQKGADRVLFRCRRGVHPTGGVHLGGVRVPTEIVMYSPTFSHSTVEIVTIFKRFLKLWLCVALTKNYLNKI